MPTEDRNNMAWWWPRIHAAGLPTPPTAMVHTDLPLMALLDGPSEGALGAAAFSDFLLQLLAAADKVRYGTGPFFLRTGHTSGKHSWGRTCYVQSHHSLGDHVYTLVEESALADMVGLPVQDWAVRALLAVRPCMQLPLYHGMPVVREFRYFVDHKAAGVLAMEVTHVQPYWPRGALLQGLRQDGDDLQRAAAAQVAAALQVLDEPPGAATHAHLSRMAVAAAKACGGGHWSVDFLVDATGVWWLTDMADGDRSYKYTPPGWRVGG